MALPSYINVGTATVAANGVAVTGQGTNWLQTVQPGDLFGTHKGAGVRIAAVNSNTSLTLAYPWLGGAQATAAYEIQITPDASRMQETARSLLETLSNGVLAAIAALNIGANKFFYYAGAGAAALGNMISGTSMFSVVHIPHMTGEDGAGYVAINNELNTATTGGSFRINANATLSYFVDNAEKLRVSATGVLEVGTVPLARLETSTGTLNVGTGGTNPNSSAPGGTTGVQISSSGVINIGVTGSGGILLNRQEGGLLMQFRAGSATGVGSITYTSGLTNYNTSSDYRLKHDIQPLMDFTLEPDAFDSLDDTLLRVMAMRPVSYRFNSFPAALAHGFIAHELQAVVPHAVTGEKDAVVAIGTAVIPDLPPIHAVTEADAPEGSTWTPTGTRPDYQSVDYSKLVVDLTAGLQSATLMILEQRAQLAEQVSTIAELSQRITALEAPSEE